jgi:hypothetical protein
MSPEKQRIAIAEACGLPKPYSMWFGNVSNTPCHSVMVKNGVKRGIPIPDYLNDLNAMHEAEATMNLTDKYQYGKSICKIMNIDTEGGLDVVDIYYACHASAAQRAEAFLRTIGEWENDK